MLTSKTFAIFECETQTRIVLAALHGIDCGEDRCFPRWRGSAHFHRRADKRPMEITTSPTKRGARRQRIPRLWELKMHDRSGTSRRRFRSWISRQANSPEVRHHIRQANYAPADPGLLWTRCSTVLPMPSPPSSASDNVGIVDEHRGSAVQPELKPCMRERHTIA